MAAANSAQSAADQGVSNSSVEQGAQSSIGSQLNDNLSFLDRYNFLSDQASNSLGKASVFEEQARTGQQVASLGISVFSNASAINSQIKSFLPKPAAPSQLQYPVFDPSTISRNY